MDKNKISSGIIKLLKSDPEIEKLKDLIETEVLNESEVKLIDDLIFNVGSIGKYALESKLKLIDYDMDEYKNIESLSKYDIDEFIDNIVYQRRCEENKIVLEKALKNSSYEVFEKDCMDLLNKRYETSIYVEKEEDFENLRNYSNDDVLPSSSNCSAGTEYIDELINGLDVGSVTSIVGTADYYKSLYALNIAYDAISKGKNVLYLSLNKSNKSTYQSFLCRHSYNDRFDKPISIVELKTQFDENLYQEVYCNFENQLKERLIVKDKKNFKVLNKYSLQRIITKVNNEFMKLNQNGIDLIIVDDISTQRIDYKHKTIMKRDIVEIEYLRYFNELASDFLGQDRKIPIVVTAESNIFYNSSLDDDNDYIISFVTDPVRIYSSTVISVYGNRTLKKSKVLKIKVLKSTDKIMTESISVFSDYDYSYLRYENTLPDDESYKTGLMKYYKNENERLEKENNKLREENMDLTINKMSNPDISLDDLDSWGISL